MKILQTYQAGKSAIFKKKIRIFFIIMFGLVLPQTRWRALYVYVLLLFSLLTNSVCLTVLKLNVTFFIEVPELTNTDVNTALQVYKSGYTESV